VQARRCWGIRFPSWIFPQSARCSNSVYRCVTLGHTRSGPLSPARKREREIPPQTDTVKTMAYFCGAVIKTEGRVEREPARGEDGREKSRMESRPLSVSSELESGGGGGRGGGVAIAHRQSLEFFSLPAHLTAAALAAHTSLVLLPDVPRVNDYRHVSVEEACLFLAIF